MYTDEMEFNDFVLHVSRVTLHATRQRVHSPAGERAATKLATPIARRNVRLRSQILAHSTDELKNCVVLSQATYYPYQSP
jgi:hypothetical protein